MCNGKTRLSRSRSTICAARVRRSCSIGAARSVRCYPVRRFPGYTTGATASLGSDQPIGSGDSILDPAGFQRQRRNFLRAVRRAKRSDTEIKLARPGISRRVSSGRTIGASRTASTRSGRFPITDAIIRNRGRAAPATSVSRRSRFQIRFSARNSCRFWTPIVTSNARLNTACSFSCSFSRRSFSSKSRRDRKFIRFNI